MRRLAVHTDSMYLIDSVTNWIFNWLSNDWQRYDGQPLKHKHEYRDLLFAMEGMDVKWVKYLKFCKILMDFNRIYL